MRPPKIETRSDLSRLDRLRRLLSGDYISLMRSKLFRVPYGRFSVFGQRFWFANDPALVRLVLGDARHQFPKSHFIKDRLKPLVGDGVLITEGETWERQRRIIDKAFAGGKLRQTYPAMWLATDAAIDRIETLASDGPIDVEEQTAIFTMDVIFRALFSSPIDEKLARHMIESFHAFQTTHPGVGFKAFFGVPGLLRLFGAGGRRDAAAFRQALKNIISIRKKEIEAGTAPDDLATKIMTLQDPETGESFTSEEALDQIVTFFLAGFETNASALSWALYLLAASPEWQAKVADEGKKLAFAKLELARELSSTRVFFDEVLRLYPPVLLLLRRAKCEHQKGDINIESGDHVVVSPLHLHRHILHWENPDEFDPGRWKTEAAVTSKRQAYIPFSTGKRTCPGAGFALIEATLFLARVAASFEISCRPENVPKPRANLTLRSKTGIRLIFQPRACPK